MRKSCFVFCFIAIFLTSFAQKEASHWTVGTNPLSLAESQMSLGPCFSYGLSKRVELWGETSLIFANAYMPDKWEKMYGLRFLFQPRYLIGEDKSIFITTEFRFKNFRFKNNLEFINSPSHDTFKNFRFTETQLLIGGGIVFGKRHVI